MKGHYIEALVASLCELGVDRPRLLAEAGLEEADLSSDVFVHHDRLESITLLAARYGKGTGVGLRTGQRLNINSHGALGYAAMASKNLEHAVQLLLKYYRVQAPRARFSLRRDQVRHFLACDPSFIVPGAPWLTAEMLVTSIYTSVDFLLSGRNQGLEVWFSHEMPPHGSDYRRVFDVPVSFSQSFNGLVIPDALAHLPPPFLKNAAKPYGRKAERATWRAASATFRARGVFSVRRKSANVFT